VRPSSIDPSAPARVSDPSSGIVQRRRTRRAFAGAALAVACLSVLGACASSGASTAGSDGDASEDFGTVSASPGLPEGFADTFESRFVEANGIRQHVVIGGTGPPLLLVHGWPENWYAWRLVMPELAENFTVIAPDQRGIGLTEQAADGYDSATLANDLAALMDELGHERFAVVGHDTGYIISYALAADHRDRVDALAVAEIPGAPGVAQEPPLFVPAPINDRLWHIPFNRVDDELIVDMVRGQADAFYRYEFAVQGGGATLPDDAIDYYTRLYNRDQEALRSSFGLYRAWDLTIEQNQERTSTPLTIPVLGIGGANSWGPAPADGMMGAANDVQTAVLPNAGHWVAEQAPEQLLAELSVFLEPYRTAAA
jgi:pimeloyl-ACP methyl ester carboxylesterase